MPDELINLKLNNIEMLKQNLKNKIENEKEVEISKRDKDSAKDGTEPEGEPD